MIWVWLLRLFYRRKTGAEEVNNFQDHKTGTPTQALSPGGHAQDTRGCWSGLRAEETGVRCRQRGQQWRGTATVSHSLKLTEVYMHLFIKRYIKRRSLKCWWVVNDLRTVGFQVTFIFFSTFVCIWFFKESAGLLHMAERRTMKSISWWEKK